MSETRDRERLNAEGRAGGFSGCKCCGDRWNWKKSHSTKFTDKRACFPLCEECWAGMTPTERLPYYRTLVFDMWGDETAWPAIEQSVLEGK